MAAVAGSRCAFFTEASLGGTRGENLVLHTVHVSVEIKLTEKVKLHAKSGSVG